MDLNRVTLLGRITQDVELKTTESWKKVTNVSLVTNQQWVDASWEKQELAEFHSLQAWWKIAEIMAQYVTKWQKLLVEGKLQTRSWEGNDGVKKYKTEIIISNMIMLEKSWNTNSEQNNTAQSEKATPKKQEVKEEEEVSIEDIPF